MEIEIHNEIPLPVPPPKQFVHLIMTKDEARLLYNIAGWNRSIPDLVATGSLDRTVVVQFLNDVRKAISTIAHKISLQEST